MLFNVLDEIKLAGLSPEPLETQKGGFEPVSPAEIDPPPDFRKAEKFPDTPEPDKKKSTAKDEPGQAAESEKNSRKKPDHL